MIWRVSIILLLPISTYAVHHEWIRDVFYHSDGSGVIATRVRCSLCGLGNDPVGGVSGGWCTCHSPPISVLVRSYSLGSSDEDDPESTSGRINSINDSLASMPPEQQAAIDWSNLPYNDMEGGGWNWSYLPPGTVVDDGSGVVSASPDGSGGYVVPVVDGTASGYNEQGKPGSWTVSPIGDNLYGSQWTPTWTGGPSDSGSWGSPANSALPLSPDNMPSIPLVDDGNGNLIVNSPPVSPTINIEVPSGSGGGSAPPVNVEVTFNMHDYSGVLNAILNGVYSGFDRQYAFLLNLDQNLRYALTSDDVPNVANFEDPSFDTSSVSSEVQSQLDLIDDSQSGWRFDFGMGSNPLGDLITGLIGDPPTSFGESDNVCDIDFDLPLAGTVHYSFVLSDWFPSAFRSCILMILSIFFAIACAKAISGAFQ